MIDLDKKVLWEYYTPNDGDRGDYNLWDYTGAVAIPVPDPRLSWRELVARFESRHEILSFFVIGEVIIAIWEGGTIAHYTQKTD